MTTDLFQLNGAALRQVADAPAAPAVIRVFVPGVAQPGGSKTATVIRRKGGAIVMKNGRALVTTRDANKKAPEWKATVRVFAAEVYSGAPLAGALRVRMVFYRQRPQGHFRSGKNSHLLREAAPEYPTGKPDVLKLARPVEDALTGLLWTDDALIVDERLTKLYCWGNQRPGVSIEVETVAGTHKPQEATDA